MNFISTWYAKGGLSLVLVGCTFFLINKVFSLKIFSTMNEERTFTMIMTFVCMFMLFAITYVIIDFISKRLEFRQSKDKMFELASEWKNLSEIDPSNIIVPDLINAINAMKQTSTAWNENVVKKEIIYANHFDDFKTLYNQISSSNALVPGYTNKTLSSFLDSNIKNTFKAMSKFKK